MDKLKFETPDMVTDNIDKIAALFPTAITEMRGENGEIKYGVNFEVLKQLLSRDVVDGDECYEFTWVGKKAAMAEAARPITKTLRPVKADSRDWDTTENLYIEGDNLEVLKILQESYLGKVKMIYIDPPYNTGNDFIYADDFMRSQEEENEQMGMYDEDENRLFKNADTRGRFHSDWCSMICSRLMLARNMLTDDGVIFISIDDNEQENLKKCCNEVLGSGNFVFQIAWRRTDNQPNIGNIARVKEYIICYAKNLMTMKFGRLPLSDTAKKEYRYSDERGLFRRAILLDKTRGRYHYPVKTKSGYILNGPWMKSEKELHELDARGLVYWTAGGDEQPYGKIYLDESKGQIPNDFWGIDFGTNQRASLEVEKIFNNRFFDFPKPVSLLSNLVKLGADNDAVILDFFSGSATTAHAVMQLNAEDGGHRKFIMVQLPEKCDESSEAYKAGYKNICEIGKERIRRAGDKIRSEHPDAKLDTGFRVFRVDESNMEDIYYHPEEMTQTMLGGMVSNIKPDRTDLDLLYACLLDWGVEISLSHTQKVIDGCTVHNVDNGALCACFAERVPLSVIDYMAKQQPLRAVFRDSSFAADDSKINVTEIFKNLSPDTKVKVI